MNCRDFFAMCFQGSRHGWVVLSFKSRTTGGMSHEWFSLSEPDVFDRMAEGANQHGSTADVYFSTCPARERPEDSYLRPCRIATKDVSCILILFMDIDTKEDERKVDADVPEDKATAIHGLQRLEYPPSIIIDSGHGLQAYWLLEVLISIQSDEGRARAKQLMNSFSRGVAAELGYSGLDLAASEPSRILRAPDTLNHKYGKMLPVKVVSEDEPRRYSVDILTQHYCSGNEDELAVAYPAASGLQSGEVISDEECIKKIRRSRKMSLLWDGDISLYGGDASRADEALSVFLWKITGGNAVQVERLMRQSKLRRHKWDERGHTRDGLTYLQLTIQKAAVYVETKRAQNQYVRVREFPLTNVMTKRLVSGSDIRENGDAVLSLGNIYRLGDVTLLIREYDLIYNELGKAMSQTVWRLLVTILMLYTEHEDQPQTVRLVHKAYAQLCGISDVKHVREQVQVDTVYLLRTSVSYQKKLRGEKIRYRNTTNQLFQDVKACTGYFEFSFSNEFYKMLNIWFKKQYMYCPVELWRINSGRYPHSFFFLLKLAEYKRINLRKQNDLPDDQKGQERVLSVKALCSASPLFPSLDDVRARGRHIQREIFDAFEKGMNALSAVLSWRYFCKGGGEPTYSGASGRTYEQFMDSYVLVEWKGYPDCRELVQKVHDKVKKPQGVKQKNL